jgi:molecular chaperone DnaJ
LRVKIPAGVEDGAVRTISGMGEQLPAGSGDLHVHVTVAPHPLFQREGADISCDVPVSFPQAALGANLDVPTLEGQVKMRLPPGTQSGRVFRLRGKGLPVFGGYGKGDELVKIVVEVPAVLTDRQRELLEELAREMGADTHPQQATFLDKLRGLFE